MRSGTRKSPRVTVTRFGFEMSHYRKLERGVLAIKLQCARGCVRYSRYCSRRPEREEIVHKCFNYDFENIINICLVSDSWGLDCANYIISAASASMRGTHICLFLEVFQGSFTTNNAYYILKFSQA